MKGHVKRTLEVLEALGFTRSDTRETFVMGEAEDAIDSDPAPEVLR